MKNGLNLFTPSMYGHHLIILIVSLSMIAFGLATTVVGLFWEPFEIRLIIFAAIICFITILLTATRFSRITSWWFLLTIILLVLVSNLLSFRGMRNTSTMFLALLPYVAATLLRTSREYSVFISILLLFLTSSYALELRYPLIMGFYSSPVELYDFFTPLVILMILSLHAYYSRTVNTRLWLQAETKNKEMQASLEAMVTQERSAALGRVVASVSHQLNNPLQIIQFALETYMVEHSPDPDECVEIAYEQLVTLTHIVGTLNKHSRPSAFDKKILVDPRTSVQEALTLVGSRIRSQGVNLDMHVDATTPSILAAPSELTQVLSVIIDNACDSLADRNGTGTRPIISIAVRRIGATAVINISDNGIGMDSVTQERLFEPFFTTKEDGVGLGLFVASNIIEKCGGRIKVRSRQGMGTEFEIKLPSAKVGDNGTYSSS